ncbi:Alpha/Beta hydrolase protein [Clohesyomyces aquaticus]|uniref:Alpha/Beta hydrolase protein n=1 Tax=Clohesyomyces aquaticus TaxID=1231657 RepID=A0A1Y1ZEW8_9PLEO|nr:Alpha/Beta hydrolase protein [Clohesyomyces aquaticus]
MPTSISYDVEIPIDPLSPPKLGEGGYVALNPHSEVLPAGWKYDHAQAKALTSPILVDHDAAINMRDGITLYADIYRPPEPSPAVPAILCCLGIKSGTLSGLEKFEGPDPADWVPRGYAIVNIDIRGTGDSQGDMAILGSQEAEDGYDTIEALAKMSWCTGKVGMAGNSHLAIAQWGGIYSGDLFDRLIAKYMLMFHLHPLANKWWNDKRPNMKNIIVPTYITGTWTNTMHGMGAIRGWLQVDSTQKWLRWHPWQEWMAVLRFGEQQIDKPQSFENIVEAGFPIPRTEYKSMYFNSSGEMTSTAPSTASVISYNSETSESPSFTHVFSKTTRLVGLLKAVLYMSCPDHDDMDLYIQLAKLSKIPIKTFSEFRLEQATEVAFRIKYEVGEGIRVYVSGQTRAVDNFGTLDHLNNKGTHKLHVRGQTPSHVILPFV